MLKEKCTKAYTLMGEMTEIEGSGSTYPFLVSTYPFYAYSIIGFFESHTLLARAGRKARERRGHSLTFSFFIS